MAQAVLERPKGDLTKRGAAVAGDRIFWLLTLVSGLLILAILALILYTTLTNAWPAFQSQGWGLILDDTWRPREINGVPPTFGLLSFIYGTVIVSLISLIIAVPVSVGIALFLTELAHRRVRAVAITVLDLLAAVPSVVFGMWGLLVFAPWILPAYKAVHEFFAPVPVLRDIFGAAASGRSFMTAGIIVAFMITPIITSITREVFATVPAADKQAALALGATKWEMIRGAVFPHSFGGVTGAIMLGLGRAMGETIAISLTIGLTANVTANVFAAGQALPSAIVTGWGEASGDFRAALIACGVILFVVTVIVNLLARSVVRRAELRMKGA